MKTQVEYRPINHDELNRALFSHFERRQVVTKCWRKVNGEWMVRKAPFVDQWSDADYQTLVKCLKNTVVTGGMVCGAFVEGGLKGFASVEGKRFGPSNEYLDLTCLHVSQELRGRGIGSRLFRLAVDWAKEKGAQKLYISSHSAVETQAFYRAMGCVEALVPCQAHVEQEPFDRQLEFDVSEREKSYQDELRSPAGRPHVIPTIP